MFFVGSAPPPTYPFALVGIHERLPPKKEKKKPNGAPFRVAWLNCPTGPPGPAGVRLLKGITCLLLLSLSVIHIAFHSPGLRSPQLRPAWPRASRVLDGRMATFVDDNRQGCLRMRPQAFRHYTWVPWARADLHGGSDAGAMRPRALRHPPNRYAILPSTHHRPGFNDGGHWGPWCHLVMCFLPQPGVPWRIYTRLDISLLYTTS